MTGLLASSLLAQRSLADHVRAVADELEKGGLDGGRNAVSLIVGRDKDSLDAAGVCRAAIESLAENFSDGVVAPVLWLTIAGLPGAAIYKAINTADSMIGHNIRPLPWPSAGPPRASMTSSTFRAPVSPRFWLVLAAMLTQKASAKEALQSDTPRRRPASVPQTPGGPRQQWRARSG